MKINAGKYHSAVLHAHPDPCKFEDIFNFLLLQPLAPSDPNRPVPVHGADNFALYETTGCLPRLVPIAFRRMEVALNAVDGGHA